jgi:hypothetical protein
MLFGLPFNLTEVTKFLLPSIQQEDVFIFEIFAFSYFPTGITEKFLKKVADVFML